MRKIYKYFRENREKDNIFIGFVRTVYKIGTIKWLHSIIVTVLSIIIPFTYSSRYYKTTIALGLLLLIDIILDCICSEYQSIIYIERRFAEKMIQNQSSLMNSINIEMQNNKNWKKTIFRKTSELVCGKIYSIFKEVLNCETRVSVEYVFDDKIKNSKDNKTEHKIKMAGRKSLNRDICKKAIPFEERKKYFSYKIFYNNSKEINILQKEEINNSEIWYKNTTDVLKYFGIAVSVRDKNKVDFILQIDCLDKLEMGDTMDTVEGMKNFINQYLMFYIRVLSLAYYLNLNPNKEIGDV